jgi:hypothetical protein
MRYSLISADNHIIEPTDLYVQRLPEHHRDRAPRVMRGTDGGDGWSFDGAPPRHTFGLEAVAGQKLATGTWMASGLTWDQILPGNFDGAAHLKDMDVDGIDAAVLYPGTVAIWSLALAEHDFALALMRAYNDWLLDDFCAADRRRLVGLVVIPVDSCMDAALGEFERTLGRGAKAFAARISAATLPRHVLRSAVAGGIGGRNTAVVSPGSGRQAQG